MTQRTLLKCENTPMSPQEPSIHAPTLTCELLRAAASVIETAAGILPGETIYFPPREGDEAQPIELDGDVSLTNIAGLVRYIADMVEA